MTTATAALLPSPRFVVLDANGKPVSGGFVNTYIPGGTTPKATWQDAAQVTPNANPVPLDSAGSAVIYGAGSYQLTITDALGVAVPGYSGVTVGNPSNPGNPGTTTNDNAAIGQIGEFISSSVVQGSAVALTTSVAANVTSISLTAGDWEAYGSVDFYPAATTTISSIASALSTASATFPVRGTSAAFISLSAPLNAGNLVDLGTGRTRFSLAATTTVYLIASALFGVSTMTAGGYIGARRMR
jgi:hypothetical protein